jgi:hypothetical protein
VQKSRLSLRVAHSRTSDSKRRNNLAFFKKLYVMLDWGENDERSAVILSAELGEPYALLLSEGFAERVEEELEILRKAPENIEDDPGGRPSRTSVSTFEPLAGRAGLEPATLRLTAECSAIELPPIEARPRTGCE